MSRPWNERMSFRWPRIRCRKTAALLATIGENDNVFVPVDKMTQQQNDSETLELI